MLSQEFESAKLAVAQVKPKSFFGFGGFFSLVPAKFIHMVRKYFFHGSDV